MDRSEKPKQTNLWERFLGWLNKKEEGRIILAPKSGGETEILLSNAQRKKLEDAVNISEAQRWETSLHRRETNFYSREAPKPPKSDGNGLFI